jgi:hypothetical protein
MGRHRLRVGHSQRHPRMDAMTKTPTPGDRLRTRTGRRLEYVRRHPCGGHFVWWVDERLEMATFLTDREWLQLRPVVEGRAQ